MRRRPSLRDAGLGVALLVLAQVEVWTSAAASVRVAAAVCATVVGAAMMWRRVLPAVSAAVALAGIVLVDALTPSEGGWWNLGLIIAMYSAGRYASTPRAVALLAGGLAADAVTVLGEDNSSVGEFLVNYLFIAVLMVAGPWMAGFMLRRREQQGIELAAAAVGDERLRIARELHDVVGHSLGVIAVQAGAERATLPGDAPASTRETLATIEQTTREALAEMRRLLSVMRGADGEAEPRAPQPTLAHVDGILDAARLAGWSAELQVEGDPAALSPGVDLAAYRIVQEAVTNAVRHSRGTHTEVTIRHLADQLQLEVRDNGKPGPTPQHGGYGLAGMRERAALYGGTVATRRDSRWVRGDGPPAAPQQFDMTIRVLVVDDQGLVRAGFRKLLEATPDLDVVGEAADGADAVRQAQRSLPDVVLMDIRMPHVDGIAATRSIVKTCGPRVRVLMLTTFGDDEYVFDSLRAGASGFLLKDAPPEDLLTAVRVVARGDALLDPIVTRSVVSAFVKSMPSRPRPSRVVASLTTRELSTLRLLATGLSNAEIADRLVLSEATVKTHVGHVLAKLDLRDRVQAVIFAYESGLTGASDNG